MMKAGKVAGNVLHAQRGDRLIAMLYSMYAIYASGKDAVMGGMLVMGVGLHHLGIHRPPLHGTAAGGSARRHDRRKRQRKEQP